MSNLINGTPHTVTFRQSAGGGTHSVSIAELEINPLYRFCHLLAGDKTPELVALCIGQEVEWLNQLDVRSFAALSKKCIELNFPNAMILMDGDLIIALKLRPLCLQVAALLPSVPPSAGATSSASSSAPARSGSAVETGI